MRLLKRYLVSETARCLDNGVRLSVIGRRDRLSRDLVRTIENTERITADGTQLHLRLAVDYSARAAIARSRSAHALAGGFRARARRGRSFRRRRARRLADPNGRRTPPQRLPALGIRLRGARVRRHVLARLRRGGVRRRAARVRAPRSPLRRVSSGTRHRPATRAPNSAAADVPRRAERVSKRSRTRCGPLMFKPRAGTPPRERYLVATATENNNEGQRNSHPAGARPRGILRRAAFVLVETTLDEAASPLPRSSTSRAASSAASCVGTSRHSGNPSR